MPGGRAPGYMTVEKGRRCEMSLLDDPRMKAYLSEKLGAEALSITSVWKNLEGWSMETYSFGLSYRKDGRPVEQNLILRKAPDAGLMADNYDVSIEYRVLTAPGQTEVAVPKTLWYELDPAILGQPVLTKIRPILCPVASCPWCQQGA